MTVVPLTLREANDFVATYHRHNKPVTGHRYSIGLQYEEDFDLAGVAIVGRPVARMLQDGTTAEVLRLCVQDDAPKNACSFLYRASWRIWRAMGGLRLVTYTLQSESGSSLKGAGFRMVGEVKAAEWSRPSRRRETQPVYGQQKLRWELNEAGGGT